MATDHEQPDTQISASPPPTVAAVPHSLDPPPLENPTTTAAAATNPPKRQRRPSVRLGEIGGDPPYEAHNRRTNKSWRFHKDPTFAAKTSKTRPLTNLVNGGGGGGGGGDSNFQDSVDLAENYADFSHRKPKIKKPTKRARTNWNKFDSATAVNNVAAGVIGGGGGGLIESTSHVQEENDINNEELREFEPDGSESPSLKEQQSPINSGENMGLHFWDEQRGRTRSRFRFSGTNGAHHHEVNSPEKHNEGNLGVRDWLIGLGLERYAPVFEIHEVDDEVLPMLTLEDLKDMGINAVGSRRKMYSSILKLRKGFSEYSIELETEEGVV